MVPAKQSIPTAYHQLPRDRGTGDLGAGPLVDPNIEVRVFADVRAGQLAPSHIVRFAGGCKTRIKVQT